MNSQSMFSDPGGWAVFLGLVAAIALLVLGLGRAWVALRKLRFLLVLLMLGVGGAFGYQVLRPQSGYLASLIFEQTFFLIVLVGVESVLLAVIPRVRRYGRLGVVGALLILAGFYAVYLGGYSLGLHAWRNDRPLPVP